MKNVESIPSWAGIRVRAQKRHREHLDEIARSNDDLIAVTACVCGCGEYSAGPALLNTCKLVGEAQGLPSNMAASVWVAKLREIDKALAAAGY